MRRDLLAAIELYLITDATPGVGTPAEFLAQVIEAGVGMVQLRERRLDDRKLLEVAREFASTCRSNGALFIVNDRVDIALACGADGVHVGQDDLYPDDVRRVVGRDFIIGLSTHSSDQIDAAASTSADYIGVGPVYETPTKPGRPAVGLDLIRYAASHASQPFFAIGGIDASNVADVRAAGGNSVSVVRFVTQADDPFSAVRALLNYELLERSALADRVRSPE